MKQKQPPFFYQPMTCCLPTDDLLSGGWWQVVCPVATVHLSGLCPVFSSAQDFYGIFPCFYAKNERLWSVKFWLITLYYIELYEKILRSFPSRLPLVGNKSRICVKVCKVSFCELGKSPSFILPAAGSWTGGGMCRWRYRVAGVSCRWLSFCRRLT